MNKKMISLEIERLEAAACECHRLGQSWTTYRGFFARRVADAAAESRDSGLERRLRDLVENGPPPAAPVPFAFTPRITEGA